jgi:predicted ThiF/HesA family dinucleotide-utilizing enzyme|tara:strand:- start:829 stop:1110 length:282 start_codon:yes stop_codon:yes gene_type:complete
VSEEERKTMKGLKHGKVKIHRTEGGREYVIVSAKWSPKDYAFLRSCAKSAEMPMSKFISRLMNRYGLKFAEEIMDARLEIAKAEQKLLEVSSE